jgi:hypothetical protein
MITEGHEFEEPDYPDEEEGIEKLLDAKGTFILWPCKDIIVKTCSSPIVSPWNKEVRGTSTSNMSKSAQNSDTLVTPPAQDPQGPELQESTVKRPPSPAQNPQGPELQDNPELTLPSAPT